MPQWYVSSARRVQLAPAPDEVRGGLCAGATVSPRGFGCDEAVDHLVELGFDVLLKVGLDLGDPAQLGERPAAVGGEPVHARRRNPQRASAPNRPPLKSSIACTICSSLFITNGP